MTKKTVALVVLAALTVALFSAACGIKGPPQPPEPAGQKSLR
ncbi:MAG: hypothetical protein ACE5GQ_12420 [Nitrospinales bacterium]